MWCSHSSAVPLSEYTTLTWGLTYTYNTMYLLCIVILYGLPVLFTVVLDLVLQVSIIIIMIRTCLYVYVFVSLPVCVCKYHFIISPYNHLLILRKYCFQFVSKDTKLHNLDTPQASQKFKCMNIIPYLIYIRNDSSLFGV